VRAVFQRRAAHSASVAPVVPRLGLWRGRAWQGRARSGLARRGNERAERPRANAARRRGRGRSGIRPAGWAVFVGDRSRRHGPQPLPRSQTYLPGRTGRRVVGGEESIRVMGVRSPGWR
jgi:hypothetical protein